MAVSIVSFSFSRAAQPEAHGSSSLLDDGFLYCILSQTGLQNSIGGPEGPFGRVWVSLPHFVSDVSDPILIRGSKGALRLAFSTTSYQQLLWSPTLQGPKGPLRRAFSPHLTSNFSGPQLSDFLSWPSYIIVQRPLNLWNGMFDRHQEEITVMQYTGRSLPVHQPMSVPWDFLPCPISSAKSAHAISFDYWPLEWVTSFRRIILEWHVWPGRRSKYNNFCS